MIIAGCDFGTSGVKLTVVDTTVAATSGGVIATGSAHYDTVTKTGGISEQNAEDWWQAAASALSQTGVANKIEAIGLTGQMQDLIPVAGTQSVRPVLLYSDTRAQHEHDALKATLPHWETHTGNHQDASNVAAKIAWLAANEPETLAHTELILLGAPGYIAWRATGVGACDVLTASTTGLLDVRTKNWYEPALSASGARHEQLPRLVGTTAGDELIGTVSESAAAWLGVPAGIPVVLAAGDAGAASDGMVGSEPGSAYVYLGTTGWLAAITPVDEAAEVSPIHSLVMPGWDTRLRIGAVQSAGAAADWARRTFFADTEFEEVERLIAPRVSDPAALAVRPLTLPGVSGERTPVRDPDFRGAFVGVHESTTAADFYLGTLTGVAMNLRHAGDAMGWSQNRIALVGGAATSSAWRSIFADVFNATIITRTTDDPGTHSAVRVTAKVLGDANLPPLFDENASGEDIVETHPSGACPLYQNQLAIHRELYYALAPTFHQLARL